MKKPERITPADCAERLTHICREVGFELSEERRKVAVRVMTENRPIMTPSITQDDSS